ncbi:MAG: methyltransferase domain-containing protein [Pseudomonadota bacterium]
MARLKIDQDLSGKRVLDIGCSDGYYSFECEKRGAKVTAIDDFTSSPDKKGVNGFTIAAELLRSDAVHRNMSVYDVDKLEGEFDVILLINVLYHLRHPTLAVDKIAAKLVPGGKLYLKSYFHHDIRFRSFGFDLTKRPLARFYPGDELNNDPSNWWGFNRRGIEALLASAGFGQIHRTAQVGDRVYYRALI